MNSAAGDLSGAKALLAAVLELEMPYTLERDDVLHGFPRGLSTRSQVCATRIIW